MHKLPGGILGRVCAHRKVALAKLCEWDTNTTTTMCVFCGALASHTRELRALFQHEKCSRHQCVAIQQRGQLRRDYIYLN